MKEKIAENISNIDKQAKPDTKRGLNPVVSVALALVVSLGVIGASPRIALADSGKMQYCEKPGESPVYVSFDNIRSYMGQPDENGNRWVCRPADAP